MINFQLTYATKKCNNSQMKRWRVHRERERNMWPLALGWICSYLDLQRNNTTHHATKQYIWSTLANGAWSVDSICISQWWKWCPNEVMIWHAWEKKWGTNNIVSSLYVHIWVSLSLRCLIRYSVPNINTNITGCLLCLSCTIKGEPCSLFSKWS